MPHVLGTLDVIQIIFRAQLCYLVNGEQQARLLSYVLGPGLKLEPSLVPTLDLIQNFGPRLTLLFSNDK